MAINHKNTDKALAIIAQCQKKYEQTGDLMCLQAILCQEKVGNIDGDSLHWSPEVINHAAYSFYGSPEVFSALLSLTALHDAHTNNYDLSLSVVCGVLLSEKLFEHEKVISIAIQRAIELMSYLSSEQKKELGDFMERNGYKEKFLTHRYNNIQLEKLKQNTLSMSY